MKGPGNSTLGTIFALRVPPLLSSVGQGVGISVRPFPFGELPLPLIFVFNRREFPSRHLGVGR